MNLAISQQFNLKAYNTMALTVFAKQYIAIKSIDQLHALLQQKALFKQAVFILGGGSNILFSGDFSGLVIHNQLKGKTVIQETAEHIWLKVAAGENWHAFVMDCVANNYGGLENLSLIPGTVGAAPIQNIGAYGVEVKDCIETVAAYELATGNRREFTNAECEFHYRDSIFKQKFKNQWIISDVTFKLNKFPELNFSYGAIVETLHSMDFPMLSIKVISDAVIKIRQSKLPDPAVIPNTGSFFKNPFVTLEHFNSLKTDYPAIPSYPVDADTIKVPAGWLIEQCGWKGKKIGNVGVHAQQALVLINHNNGSAAEMLALVETVQQSVMKKFNIMLEIEVVVV